MANIEKEIVKEENKMAKGLDKLIKNPWAVTSIVLAILLIILVIYISMHWMPSGKAANNLVNFLNDKVGGGITIQSVSSLGSIYQVNILYQGQEMPIYVSNDGKYFIQSISPIISSSSSDSGSQTQEIPKTDKPVVDLYVMSFCPYGNQAENTMYPVYNLLKNKMQFNVHYIVSISGTTVSSLHGQKEVDEDMREACVLNESGMDKWWKFITYVNNNCGSDGSCWEAAAKNASLDTTKIKTCVTNKGLALMKADEAASAQAGAGGSPTLIINGVQSSSVYQYGNSEAYKSGICSGFTSSPSECSQTLGASTTTGSSGSCST